MNYANVKAKAVDFFSEAGFVSHIHDEADYEKALALMDELVDEYDTYLPLIEVLSASIERWENEAEYFSEFNQRIAGLGDGVAVLRTLMDQYALKTDDFKNEIGGKSLVSMILSGDRKLTIGHIQALSARFHIPVGAFFPAK